MRSHGHCGAQREQLLDEVCLLDVARPKRDIRHLFGHPLGERSGRERDRRLVDELARVDAGKAVANELQAVEARFDVGEVRELVRQGGAQHEPELFL